MAAERRGLAVGLTSTIGLQAIPLLGPLIIVGIGTAYGWREAFWVAGVPGLIMAAAIWLLVRNPPHTRTDDTPKGAVWPAAEGPQHPLLDDARDVLNMTSYGALLGFGPLYIVNVAGLGNGTMSVIMTGVGMAGGVLCFRRADAVGSRRPQAGDLRRLRDFDGRRLAAAFGDGSLPCVRRRGAGRRRRRGHAAR